jgi:hypothetical protein
MVAMNSNVTNNIPLASNVTPTPTALYWTCRMFARCDAEFMKALCSDRIVPPSGTMPTFSPARAQPLGAAIDATTARF